MSQINDGEYIVVEFKEEEDCGQLAMAVVSSTWVVIDNGSDHYCYWPQYINKAKLSKLVIEHTEIDLEQCSRCPINIKYRSRVYTRACDKMKMLEIQSSVSQSDPDDCTRSTHRRRTKKNPHYEDFHFDNDSSDSYENIPPAPKVIPVKTFNVPFQKGKIYSNLESQPYNIQNDIVEEVRRPESVSSCPASAISVGNSSEKTSYICSGCKKNEDILINLMGKIESIGEDIKFLMLAQGVADSATSRTITPLQPCCSKEELEQLNDSLTNDDKFQSLCVTLQTVGGKDTVDTIRRILNRLISNNLAINYNWTGRNNKNNFSVLKNVINLILVAVRKNPFSKGATQQQVEDITKLWLRNANDREGGRGTRTVK